MAKGKRAPNDEERRSAADYYKLNLKAVDDLVTADKSNSPKVSEAELRRYRSGPRLKLSDWMKALLVKAWFSGATCFFFLWGLGTYLSHWLDQLVVLGLALGFVTDLLVNNALRFFAPTEGANDRFMMLPKRGFWTLPLNLLYAFWLLFCVVTSYNVLNLLLTRLGGATLGVGPILFGAFTTAWDMLFIAIKRTARRMVADARGGTGHRV